MTRYLLDTNVLSETRKPRPHGGVLAWLQAQNEEQLFLPALIFGEIQCGIELARRAAPQRVAGLEAWLRDLGRHPRIIVMNAPCFRAWALLMCVKPADV